MLKACPPPHPAHRRAYGQPFRMGILRGALQYELRQAGGQRVRMAGSPVLLSVAPRALAHWRDLP